MTAAPIIDDELPALFAGLERTPLALCVSGGSDSMALMLLAARWAALPSVRSAWLASTSAAVDQGGGLVAATPSWVESTDHALGERRRRHVVVLTVDHGLRSEAAAEAAFVAHSAGSLGLVCSVLGWAGNKPASGVQAAAREARRNLLADEVRRESNWLAARTGLDGMPPRQRTLVMAHQQEDQAETFLMRLGRGSGLEGLGGMRPHDTVSRPPTAADPVSFEVGLLRPLLEVPKARLVATLRAAGTSWIEDRSNEDDRFERVRIRKALGTLEGLGLTAEKIALSARRLRDAEIGFVRLLDGRAPGVGSPHRIGAAFAELDMFASDFASRYTATRFLKRLLRLYGGEAKPADYSQLEALASLTQRPQSRAGIGKLTLGGCKIEVHGEHGRFMRVFREGAGEELPVAPLVPGQSVDWDGGRFRLTAAPSAQAGATVQALSMQGWANLKRAIPALARLRLPAAAIATLPVVIREGITVASPALDLAIGDGEGLDEAGVGGWRAYAGGLEKGFSAVFAGSREMAGRCEPGNTPR
ncbi:MAG: tRNA lysidine(34) synthetase TilS [Hyphomicrobiaceae bacterium]|nr:tRNA lysidine(34) synthetase TilS [Hyphomicrobiaceae bacterium]